MIMESVIIKNLYPSQFYQFVNDPESEYSNPEYIDSKIKEMITELKNNKKFIGLNHMVGNIFIDIKVLNETEEMGKPCEDMYRVIVAKNYQSVYINHDLTKTIY